MLVDVSSPAWAVLYTNEAFTAATGKAPECATCRLYPWTSPAGLHAHRAWHACLC